MTRRPARLTRTERRLTRAALRNDPAAMLARKQARLRALQQEALDLAAQVAEILQEHRLVAEREAL